MATEAEVIGEPIRMRGGFAVALHVTQGSLFGGAVLEDEQGQRWLSSGPGHFGITAHQAQRAGVFLRGEGHDNPPRVGANLTAVDTSQRS